MTHATAWNRMARRFLSVVPASVMVLSQAGNAHGQESKSARSTDWRIEVEGHGAWLPGDGARGGAGVGLGAGYGFASAGVEVWRYTLTLEDSLNDNRTRIDSTLIVPLRVGIRFQPVDAPLVVGAAGGVGLLLVAPEDTQDVGRCTSIQYGGAAGLLRAFVGWDAGLLIVATHLGVTKNLSKAAVDSCGIYFNPGAEPYRRDLPDELPFGIQLGLSVTLSYP